MSDEANSSRETPASGPSASLNPSSSNPLPMSETPPTASQTMEHASPPSPQVKPEYDLTDRAHSLDAHSPFTHSPATTRSSQVSDNDSSKNKRSYYLISHEEDEWVKAYNPAREPLPKKEVNHKSFSEAEGAASSIPAEIIAMIDEHECLNEDITYIKDMAKDAMSPNYPTGVKIGLRGDSGTGKSSLINSLLGIANIAPQSDDGGACTSVVQEFYKPRPDQQNAFEAEIFFLTPSARLAILKEWLKDVYIFEHSDAEPSDDVFERFEQASSTAIEGLFSLFCDRDECRSREEVQKFLSTAKSPEDAGMISKLKGWTDELLDSLQTVPGKVSIGDSSEERMQHELSRYLQHELSYDTGIPSPWPFVKLVKTYFDSPILSQDIVLVDLPGTSDTNQTRMRASLQYLNDVDYIGVVSKVDRVETDADTHRYLIDAFRRKRGASVLLVATSSDSVNTKSTYLNRRISTADAVDAANLTTLKEELEMIELELQKAHKELKLAHTRRDRDSIESLTEEKGSLGLQKVSLEGKLSEYCVRMRNAKVSRNVRQKYFDLTKDAVPLPMYCVSNSEYAVHTSGYNTNRPPTMSVDGTGIPALRSFLYGLPAVRKFRAFEHHRKVVLPSLLNNLEMTCSQTKLMQREKLHKILLSASAPVADEIQRIFEGFFNTAIVPGIATIKTNRVAYADYATTQLSRWTKWANATHKAFCLHKGNWSTKKVGKHDWNRIMLEPLIKAVEKDIRGWDDASNALASNLSDKLNAVVTDLISWLEGAAGSSKGTMKLFFDELRVQYQQLDLKCQLRVEKVERDLSVIKERLTNTSDTKDCYFIKILSQTYDECGAITGPGARELRADRLKSKLSERVRGPFLELFNTARGASIKVIQHHMKELTNEVNGIFAGFNLTFMHSFKTDEADTPEVKELREELRARVADWRHVLTNDIDRHLITCTDYAQSG